MAECKLGMPALGGMLCAFEFPGCAGCSLDLRPLRDVVLGEDPLKSSIFRQWTQSLGIVRDGAVGLDDFGLNAAAPSR
jgi:hypothetical protein